MFITTGLVLTGGGSLLCGMLELAKEIFNVPVRLGKPRYEYPIPEKLNSPLFATAYGLLISATKKENNIMDCVNGPLVKRVLMRMKSWVSDFF
jgi:cell division protein FtsA